MALLGNLRVRDAGRPNSLDETGPSRALVNSGSQSNFSRSHEHATQRSTGTRHSNDAAVPARYLTRLGNQSHAKTYAHIFRTQARLHRFTSLSHDGLTVSV